MGAVLSFFSGFVAPLFLIISPITSYADQIASIYRTKSSAGFSMDIPLIMLVSSTLRVFYFPGAKYDVSLLIQALIMLVMQVLLLHVALENRPSSSHKGGDAAQPFASIHDASRSTRPYNFWQWKSSKPYWQALLYLFITLCTLELLLAPFPTIYPPYSSLIGYLGLAIEAILPLPQILSNARQRSCRGFRISVLISWLAGDSMKMLWFFTAQSTIPWPFKMCGIFQACCDSYLGVQYWMYGSGEEGALGVPSHRGHSHPVHAVGNGNGHAQGVDLGGGIKRSRSPLGGVHIPMLGLSEKEERLD